MPAGIWNLEFLNSNFQRSYPLAEFADGVDVTGSFTLPDSFLGELDLPIDSGMSVYPWQFFLQSLTAYATGFSLVVGYQPASGPAVSVAAAMIPAAAHVPGQTYALGGIGSFADTVGKVVIGRLDEINQQPAGSFNFSFGSTALDPDCVRPILQGVSALYTSNGSQTSLPLYGDVVLVAGANIQLTPVIASGQDPQIVISAIQGAGLNEVCACTGSGGQPAVPITTINGIPGTAGGDFTIQGGGGLSPSPIANGIQLTDTASTPCCGCTELETITQALSQFQNEAATLQNFVTSLQAQVNTMDSVVLGSKLSDQSCVQCS